jgi:hypothetical protein
LSFFQFVQKAGDEKEKVALTIHVRAGTDLTLNLGIGDEFIVNVNNTLS